MVTLNQVSIRIRDIRSFRGLLEVYEDLAAQKMQKVRGEIASYREYTGILTTMSSELEVDISSVVKKNVKQKAAVLISSDKGLYGNAFGSVSKEFSEYLQGSQADAFVVGGIGDEILRNGGHDLKYQLINSDVASLNDLWKTLSEYQEINIYYLRYDSLAKQSVDKVHISGSVLPSEDESYEYNKENKLRFLYEPSVMEVAEVFAKEILSFLAEQTMKEADLAKYAARLMYLDSSIERNNISLSGTLKQKMILTKRLANKRQNARMASYLTRNANN